MWFYYSEVSTILSQKIRCTVQIFAFDCFLLGVPFHLFALVASTSGLKQGQVCTL